MPFQIVTDHRPNTYLDSAISPHELRRRARWLDISYDHEWEPMVQQWLVPDLQNSCDLSPSTLGVARIENQEEGVHHFFESNFLARVIEVVL